MALRGTADRYGKLATGLHWIVAVATIAQLGLGLATAAAADDAHRTALLRIHAPLGALILVLTAIRIVWWLLDRRPSDPPGQALWQSRMARTAHRLLVLITVIAAVSGMGLLVRSGANHIIFGAAAGPLPDFAPFFQRTVHGAATALLLALLGLHVLAALYHQFYRRDRLFARIGIGIGPKA